MLSICRAKALAAQVILPRAADRDHLWMALNLLVVIATDATLTDAVNTPEHGLRSGWDLPAVTEMRCRGHSAAQPLYPTPSASSLHLVVLWGKSFIPRVAFIWHENLPLLVQWQPTLQAVYYSCNHACSFSRALLYKMGFSLFPHLISVV